MAALPTDPDVFDAATWIAAKDHISVDTALLRLQRAARTAGLSSEETARQNIGSAKISTAITDDGLRAGQAGRAAPAAARRRTTG